ncbi:MAG: exonuclease SbcCD subunit D [Lachnospiraceae bacterium]|nr:exonuclease SbcCD subunit D [Lachnospiraceae bacterium]
MILLHTSDLHLGKTVNEFSMLSDQRYVLDQILEIAENKKVDALLVAGDIYDRSIPGTEAVALFDEFLNQLQELQIPVLLISGNHDSAERVSFADRILEKQGVYIAGTYEGTLKQVDLTDAYGTVSFVFMPFLKPAVVDARTSEEAVEKLLQAYWAQENDTAEKGEDADKKRHVLLTHFFVTANGREPELSDAETTIQVGGLDNVDAGVFEGFDYVALGHIHKPQQMGERPVYYAGSPVKYSFSEAGHQKCVNLVTLSEKGKVKVEKVPLKPLHEMRRLKGKLEDLLTPAVLEECDREDYIEATLTDEMALIDPMGTMRSVYPNTMQIRLESGLNRTKGEHDKVVDVSKSPLELFYDFYRLLREEEPDEERKKIVEAAMRMAGEDEA